MSTTSFIGIHRDKPYIDVYVQPNAKRRRLAGCHDNRLKIQLTSPPADGRANNELRAFFSEITGAAKSQIELVTGQHSRRKRLVFSAINVDQLHSAIEQWLP